MGTKGRKDAPFYSQVSEEALALSTEIGCKPGLQLGLSDVQVLGPLNIGAMVKVP